MPRTLSRTTPDRRHSARAVAAGLTGLLLLAVCLQVLPRRASAAAATFIVNSTGDGADANAGDGVCNDGSGNCTLRAAIQEANASSGADTINFQIGSVSKSISLTSALPTVTGPVVIDGTIQTGFAGKPVVELKGPGNGSTSFDALKITAGASTVKGLAINRINGAAIVIESGGGNLVAGNFIGVDLSGTAAAPNSGFGVIIQNSPNNTLGGITPEARNVISANFSGINVVGAQATGNVIQGNYVGTDVTGTLDLGNNFSGILVGAAPDNTIGGTTAGAGNLISGNNNHGIEQGSGTGTRILGNFIGTNAAGTAALRNEGNGIFMGGTGHTVGGTTPEARNVISGNLASGVNITSGVSTGNKVQGNYIGTNAAGNAALPNSTGVTLTATGGNLIGGTEAGARNVISGNSGNGITINGSPTADPAQPGNKVQGNYIGTNAAGDARLPNNLDGVRIDFSRNHTIGGTEAGARNVISGNNQNGVNVAGNATNNVVAGNYIGTNAAGDASVFNDRNGVRIEFSQNTVGGNVAAARNVISGNRSYGVSIEGGQSNAVQGNYIGTNAAGNADVQNLSGGVRDNATGTLIGGLTATPGTAPGNVISGNQSAIEIFTAMQTTIRGNLLGTNAAGTAKLIDQSFGVLVSGPTTIIGGTDPGARNVISGFKVGIFGGGTIQGNYIGTDIDGTAAIPNREFGIRTADSALIGGTAPGARNVISGNANGVWLRGVSVAVQGNYIGASSSGAALPNTGHGVVVGATAHDNVVGGTAAGAANLIAFNGGSGVLVANTFPTQEGTPVNNTLRANSIHSNGLLGIDLVTAPPGSVLLDYDGPTPNDAGDADTGTNGLQNYPVLLSVTTGGGNTNVGGTLNSKAGAAYTVDFYANTSCDPSGHGEGQTFVGSTQVTTDSVGNAPINASFPTPASGQIITATATDSSGATSEFSVCHEGSAPGTVQFDSATFAVAEGVATATVTVTRTLGSAGAATVNYATSDGTAKAGEDYTPASGTLSFAAGETTRTFTVTILDDSSDEEVETVNLTLSNPTGGIVVGGNSTSAINVTDNDSEPTLSFVDFRAFTAEGNSGTAEAVFNVRLSAPSGKPVTVNYNTNDGEAMSGVDYQPASGTLTFAPGETAKTVTVLVNGDTAPEPDENFELNLFGPVNASFVFGSTASVFGFIWDDDSAGIHFSAPNYTVAERDGSVTIGVVRRGDASAAASVFYDASGGASPIDVLASGRHDFTEARGRLDFAPGETQKSFTVLVNDDSYVEGDEHVSLGLSFPSDINSFLLANLTITSEDTNPPPPNPVDDTQFFVRQHYHDFLNREPDAPGLAFWSNEIDSCGSNQQCREVRRINVSAAFFLSIEFQNTGYFAYRTYKAAYGDATSFGVSGTVPVIRLHEFLADAHRIGQGVNVGIGNWQQQLEDNKNAYAREFVVTERFLTAYPTTMTADEFVTKLDQNAGGVLTASEKAQLVASLGATPADSQKRAAVLRSVADDEDLHRAELNRAFVLMEYFGYLRRNPDDTPEPTFNYGGWKFWLDKLNDNGGNFIQAEMVKAFISSDEYRMRFGQ